MNRSTTALGALIAGGASRRFGTPKARAMLHGQMLAEHVRDHLRQAVPAVVLVGSDEALGLELGLPVRPDRLPDRGPLSGVHTAVFWAAEQNRTGALCLSCDTPFVPAGLLRAVVRHAERTGAPVVMSASHGRRGFEPLCGYYSVQCLPRLERHLHHGRGSLYSLLDACGGSLLPLERVRRFGRPERMFFNINTPHDLRYAATLAVPPAPSSLPQPARPPTRS